jgi:hypothetical protein
LILNPIENPENLLLKLLRTSIEIPRVMIQQLGLGGQRLLVQQKLPKFGLVLGDIVLVRPDLIYYLIIKHMRDLMGIIFVHQMRLFQDLEARQYKVTGKIFKRNCLQMKMHSFVVKVVVKMVVNQTGFDLTFLIVLNFNLSLNDVQFNEKVQNLLLNLTRAQKMSRARNDLQVLVWHE